MEMLENDEYEIAKNSFYHPKDKNKILKKEKSIQHLNNLNTIKGLYNDQKPLRPIIYKKYMNNESNITELNSNNNYPANNKYNYKNNYSYNNYTINNSNNRSLNIIKNNNNSRQLQLLSSNKSKNINNIYPLNCNKENEVANKINNHNTINNKKEDIFSIRMISDNKKVHLNNQNTESLHISSNIFTSEGDKICKIPTTLNEPIKLLQNQNIRNSVNIYSSKEESNIDIPISSINNGSSYINNIFESQISKMPNKKPNQLNSISSIQPQSRQKENKYISNPSFDNILRSKKAKQ